MSTIEAKYGARQHREYEIRDELRGRPEVEVQQAIKNDPLYQHLTADLRAVGAPGSWEEKVVAEALRYEARGTVDGLVMIPIHDTVEGRTGVWVFALTYVPDGQPAEHCVEEILADEQFVAERARLDLRGKATLKEAGYVIGTGKLWESPQAIKEDPDLVPFPTRKYREERIDALNAKWLAADAAWRAELAAAKLALQQAG